MKAFAGLSIVVLLAVGAACGSDDSGSEPTVTTKVPPPTAPPPGVGIHEVIEDFEYYNPCQNSSIEVNGTTYWVIPEGTFADEASGAPIIDESYYPPPPGPEGLVKIAPPEPGDDTGTLVIYRDGIARFESDSGIVSWFVDEEITYNWVC